MARKKQKKTIKKRKKTAPRYSSNAVWGLRYWILPLVVITGIVMSPVITNDFISLDDENFILINPVVQEHDFAGAFVKQVFSPHYKPLVYIGWIIEHMLFGNRAFIFHFNNWLLHLLNTVLVFFCMMRLASFWERTKDVSVPIAFFTALLFGVHPLHVESVAWAIERKDVLFTAFYLGGLLWYFEYLRKKQPKYVLYTAGFYVLGLLSKSMAISLLPVLFVIDLAAGRRDWRKMLFEKWPVYIAFVLALFLYGFFYQPEYRHTKMVGGAVLADIAQEAVLPPATLEKNPGIYQNLVVANYRYLFFAYHTFVPVKLAIVYARQYLLSIPGGLIHAFLLITLAMWSLPLVIKKYRIPIFTGLAFFTVTIAPILVEDGVGSNFVSDRYTYVPSIGLLLLLALLLIKVFPQNVWRQFTLGMAVLSAIAAIYGVIAIKQARLWGDDVALFTQAIENYPGNSVAYSYRAGALKDDAPLEALEDFNKSIELNPIRPGPYYSRGTLLLNLRRYQEAIPDFDFVISRKPRKWEAYVNRANCYRDLGNNDRALEDYNYVLQNAPDFCKAINNRGVVYLNRGQFDKALSDFNGVIARDPTYYNAYINKAAVYVNPEVKEFDKAIEAYDMALKYDPDNTQAYYFKGYSYFQLGRYKQALNSLNNAISINSANGNYYFTRARILRELGRRQESEQDARRAQQLGVNVPSSYFQ